MGAFPFEVCGGVDEAIVYVVVGGECSGMSVVVGLGARLESRGRAVGLSGCDGSVQSGRVCCQSQVGSRRDSSV